MSVSGLPFTAEELSLLDRLLALKREWRELTEQLRRQPIHAPGSSWSSDAPYGCTAVNVRLCEIDVEARRLRAQAASARQRRMIALGHVEPGETPLVLASDLRLGPPAVSAPS